MNNLISKVDVYPFSYVLYVRVRKTVSQLFYFAEFNLAKLQFSSSKHSNPLK